LAGTEDIAAGDGRGIGGEEDVAARLAPVPNVTARPIAKTDSDFTVFGVARSAPVLAGPKVPAISGSRSQPKHEAARPG